MDLTKVIDRLNKLIDKGLLLLNIRKEVLEDLGITKKQILNLIIEMTDNQFNAFIDK